jgi:hypothetical protein
MRGDLALIVKQQSLTGFNVKLTPMGSWSVPTINLAMVKSFANAMALGPASYDYFGVGTRQCRVLHWLFYFS